MRSHKFQPGMQVRLARRLRLWSQIPIGAPGEVLPVESTSPVPTNRTIRVQFDLREFNLPHPESYLAWCRFHKITPGPFMTTIGVWVAAGDIEEVQHVEGI